MRVLRKRAGPIRRKTTRLRRDPDPLVLFIDFVVMRVAAYARRTVFDEADHLGVRAALWPTEWIHIPHPTTGTRPKTQRWTWAPPAALSLAVRARRAEYKRDAQLQTAPAYRRAALRPT